METSTFTITPSFFELEGATVKIIETSQQPLITGETWYIVTVQIIYKGITSRTFPIFAKNTKDLINKLKVEITKIKIIDYSYGTEELKRLIT